MMLGHVHSWETRARIELPIPEDMVRNAALRRRGVVGALVVERCRTCGLMREWVDCAGCDQRWAKDYARRVREREIWRDACAVDREGLWTT